MRPSLEKVQQFMKDGCVDLDACAQIKDNYDAVIPRFFEGDVPMMACSGDTVSGTKKREERSEAFIANPFAYTFAPIPMSERRLLLQRVQTTAALPPAQRSGTSRVLWSLYHDGRFGCPGDAAALRCLGRLQDEALQLQQKSSDARELTQWLDALCSSEVPWLCYQPE
jgi:hypothetical protein